MACRVEWTASARNDVEDIVRHIAIKLDSPGAASAHLNDFLAAADRIAEFPEACAIGAHPALASRDLRPCFVRKYVILYSYDGEAAIVYRVFHTLQDYAHLIERNSS